MLLASLGFRNRGGTWRKADAHVVFLGDLVDRGPQQLQTIEIVRRMVDAGISSVCLGNHEFNAIGWATTHPDVNGAHLRTRDYQNRGQHEAFLKAVGEDTERHREVVAWFKTMPLWIEFPGFRAVHACWDPNAQRALAPFLGPGNILKDDALLAMFTKRTHAQSAAEIILKGPEVLLPNGRTFRDRQKRERREARIRWWDREADTYRKAALVDYEIIDQLPDEKLPCGARITYDGVKPVFFGHYWMTGTPSLLNSKMACLDFSVVNTGVLAAYRFVGEQDLLPENLVYVGR